MDAISMVKPRDYAESLQVLEGIVFYARSIVRLGYPADIAAAMLDEALQHGLFRDADFDALGELAKEQFHV